MQHNSGVRIGDVKDGIHGAIIAGRDVIIHASSTQGYVFAKH